MQIAGPKMAPNGEREPALPTDPTALIAHLTKALRASEEKLRAVGEISERAVAAELVDLRRDAHHYRQMIDTAQEGVWLRDAYGCTTFVNPRMCDMLGYTPDEMMGRPVYDFIGSAAEAGDAAARHLSGVHTPETLSFRVPAAPGDSDARAEAEARFAQRKEGVCQQHDVRYKHKNGSDVWTIVSASPIYNDDGVFVGALGMITDITERKRHEEIIWRQAYYDTLTGLANRSLLEDRLQQLLIPRDMCVAVMFIDLDRFKQVNDTLGHDFGDRLLNVVAGRLAGSLRADDTIARMGGDEFAALLPGIDHREAVEDVARTLLEVLAQPIEIDSREVSIAASIGISLFPTDGHDVQTLLKHADVAMYRAKEQGGNECCLFNQSMNANALERLTLENNLRKALSREEFFLVYQPQLDLDTGEVVAVEALCRWRHPEMGVVPPARFIPLAEETGMIVPLGEWVLREACRQAAEWRDEGQPVRVTVNISTRQLSQPGLPRLLRSILTDTGLEPQWLELELTESAIMKSTESAADVLLSLRDIGIRLALDDFGTGYSSLSYLRQFHFDVLKIDRSFIADIVGDNVNQALVRAILELSHALELEVVAEGVECDDQRRILRALGCRVIQGYLFSPPVLASQIPLLRTVLRAA
jgi:diguanylate cyclase (GGDEF)-like protein/PAS domain S-box-containing protein